MNSVKLACPGCQVELQIDSEQYVCPICRQVYTRTLDIPSLCRPEETVTQVEKDLIQRLCQIYPTATVDEMSRARLATGVTNEERRQFYANYHRTLYERGPAFYQMFRERLQQQGWTNDTRRITLDIGCGIGGGLLAMAREFDQVVGLDISLSALIIARKVIDEAGLTNVTLVHASAHQLPFLDHTFDYAMSINVLEHIFTPETMLSEVCRVLASGGVFGGDSRNRFDPFFKEPHVGVRWVGFMPRHQMARYVRWRTGLEYTETHTYLLSYRNLRHALKTAFGSNWRIVIPDVAAYGVSRSTRGWVESFNRINLLRPLLVRISPSHIVLARRA